MTESFTQSDLIRYIYQEMTERENENLVQALQENPILMQEYIELLSTVESLNCLFLSPSEKIVIAIKEKAQSSGLEKV
ncbi:MAG: hypothetical protein WD431_18965 [Cyclobacteriaceae bacterium]